MSRTLTNRFSGLRTSCAAAVETAYRTASASPAGQWVRQMLASDPAQSSVARDALATSSPAAAAEHMQSLEARQLLASIGLSGGLLTITGDSSTVHLGAKLDSTGTKVLANTGSTVKSFDKTSVTAVKIIGGSASEYM